MSQKTWQEQAHDFLTKETQFHLGFLPTEQPNPLTKSLTSDFQKDSKLGVRCLQKVDFQMLPRLKETLSSERFQKMCEDAYETLEKGGRIIFSGCGATGRLSILLQAMWKRGCKKYGRPDLGDRVEGIQTGGDFAVVRCIPSFEDFKIVGYQ